ncbi:MAG: hypothetical protein EP343_17060 [Deltaproteobacteria bacterium]|nr:MAG: hypothetical protein EP343_17060 [Deltaproteobacteria bacterium]
MKFGTLALLCLSVLALIVGPIVSYGLRRRHWFWSALDGFVLISVGGFVLLHVLPHSIESLGWWALLIATVGFFAPVLLGKLHSVTQRRAQSIALALALVGLVVHAALDGMALGLPNKSSSGFSALALAVVVHRLPMGLAIWMLVRSLMGTRAAIVVLGLVIASTLGGFFLAGQQALMGATWVGALQAAVAGMLLHVLLHHPNDPEDEGVQVRTPLKWAEFLGAFAGLAMVGLFSMTESHDPAHAAHAVDHAHHLSSFGHNFLHLALTSAPALLLGYILAGLLPLLFPRSSMSWLRKGSSMGQVSRGVLFGLPLPICSCGVVPLYQSLIRKGVPTTAAMAFLIATPELGVESLILSVPLLGGQLTGVRLASAFVVAMSVGWLVGRQLPMPEAVKDVEPSQTQQTSWMDKGKRVYRTGFVEILDDTAPWILAGLVIAALVQPAALTKMLAYLPYGTDVVLFAVVGIPMYVCASGATPLAAALIFAGVSPGAAIAFLLAGPATNVTTFGVLSRLHSTKIAAWFGATVILFSVGLGYLTNMLLGVKFASPMQAHHHHHSTSWLEWGSLGILGLAFLMSVLRQGTHGFLLSIFSWGSGDSDEHDHDHSHEHGHEHSHEHAHDHEPCETNKTSCCSKDLI